MLTGAHAIIYSSNAEADRAFFRDVLRLGSVDAGGGWLIFALPLRNSPCTRQPKMGGTSSTSCATMLPRSWAT